MTDEDGGWDTPTTVELPYSDWLVLVDLTGWGLTKIREEIGEENIEEYEEARGSFLMNLERPEEVESILENRPELQKSLRKAMSGLIPEFQVEINDDTVYCQRCDGEYDFTPSVLSLHNMRRHEYVDDVYDYDSRACSDCGSIGNFEGTEGQTGVLLLTCSECGYLQ